MRILPLKTIATGPLFAAAFILAGCGSAGTAMTPNSTATIQNSPAAGSSNPKWFVYQVNAGILQPPVPASVSGGTASFNFGSSTVYTAELLTKAKSLTGNLTGKTLSDSVSTNGITSGASFTYDVANDGGCTGPGAEPNIRFYFATPGSAATDAWYAPGNGVSVSQPGIFLAADLNVANTISAALTDPTQWSDNNGQLASSSTTLGNAFSKAAKKVSTVGLVFGGGCFFGDGVTTSDGSGTFSSAFSE